MRINNIKKYYSTLEFSKYEINKQLLVMDYYLKLYYV